MANKTQADQAKAAAEEAAAKAAAAGNETLTTTTSETAPAGDGSPAGVAPSAPKPGKIEVLARNGAVSVLTDGVSVWKHNGDIKGAQAPANPGKQGVAPAAAASVATEIVELSRGEHMRVVSDGVRVWKEPLPAEAGAA